jgi:hypothetical protein
MYTIFHHHRLITSDIHLASTTQAAYLTCLEAAFSHAPPFTDVRFFYADSSLPKFIFDHRSLPNLSLILRLTRTLDSLIPLCLSNITGHWYSQHWSWPWKMDWTSPLLMCDLIGAWQPTRAPTFKGDPPSSNMPPQTPSTPLLHYPPKCTCSRSGTKITKAGSRTLLTYPSHNPLPPITFTLSSKASSNPIHAAFNVLHFKLSLGTPFKEITPSTIALPPPITPLAPTAATSTTHGISFTNAVTSPSLELASL